MNFFVSFITCHISPPLFLHILNSLFTLCIYVVAVSLSEELFNREEEVHSSSGISFAVFMAEISMLPILLENL